MIGAIGLVAALIFRVPTQIRAAPVSSDWAYQVFLPMVSGGGCQGVTGEVYNAIGVNPPPTDRPAEQHADLNLALRGYAPTTNTLGLVDYGGPTDPKDPQLATLFGDQRVPTFSSVSQVYDWSWDCNCRADPITDPPVTLAGMSVAANETLYVPESGYNIGTNSKKPPEGVFLDSPAGEPNGGVKRPGAVLDDPNAYEALVLYAAENRITLKYTREDNVVRGYTLHVENVCVAPSLLALYQQWNAAGRAQLPALKEGQSFGRARGTEIGVVIRDNGSFMDPRSRKDWWKGK